MSDEQLECVLTSWAADGQSLRRIRREVFIDEQRVPESEEWDGEDNASVHALARLNREPVGTGRLSSAGKIGRIAVIAGLRGRGIGALILRRLLEAAHDRGIREPYLHAQLQAVPFYEKFGFRGEGEVFDEAGILHVRMRHATGATSSADPAAERNRNTLHHRDT
ncbi:MAG: GNAT family N-acetyltransferase [Steroidobacteraceae bacterium]